MRWCASVTWQIKCTRLDGTEYGDIDYAIFKARTRQVMALKILRVIYTKKVIKEKKIFVMALYFYVYRYLRKLQNERSLIVTTFV